MSTVSWEVHGSKLLERMRAHLVKSREILLKTGQEIGSGSHRQRHGRELQRQAAPGVFERTLVHEPARRAKQN